MSLRFSHDTIAAPRERVYVRVDRIRGRMRRLYRIQPPATLRERHIRWGFVARFGHLRLRCYLLAREKAPGAAALVPCKNCSEPYDPTDHSDPVYGPFVGPRYCGPCGATEARMFAADLGVDA